MFTSSHRLPITNNMFSPIMSNPKYTIQKGKILVNQISIELQSLQWLLKRIEMKLEMDMKNVRKKITVVV